MRKLLNYLLGEDIVSGQNDREIKETIAGAIICALAIVYGLFVLYVCG